MPKGVYVRKSRKSSVDSPSLAKSADEDNDVTGVEEEEDEDGAGEDEEGDGSDEAPRKRRRKKRKALFTREKPQRRAKAAERNERRAQKAARAKAGEESEEEEKDEEEEKEEELSFPQPSKEQLLSFSPLQLLLDNLLRCFHRKDPEEYFVFPVTDEVAPGYSEVVSNQMNFYTMRSKVDANEYTSLAHFKNDMTLILKNCYAYNKPHTVYYSAAKKLEQTAAQYFSREHLVSLAQSLPFLRSLGVAELGFALPPRVCGAPDPPPRRPQTSVVVDNMGANDVLAQAQRAAVAASGKLAARRPNARLAFLNQKEDGTTALCFVTPEARVEPDEKRRRIRLADVCPPPKEGNPGLQPWSEASENLLAPVNFLNYGPYASFAPQYDSTWASVGKDDSAKLLATYGERDAVEYAWSLRNFVSESGDELIGMVDSLLDTLTQGEHSKLHGKADVESLKTAPPETPLDVAGLRSLAHLGIDVSFLDTLGPELVAQPTQLEETAALLGDLERVQRTRLSKAPALTLRNAVGPGEEEVALAGAVVEKLSSGVAAGRPQDVVGEKEIRACLGITDDIDMDLFNEFLVPEA